ncbi:MAG: antitoxin [Saccharothrix sp.]|nr:antitoxin [Saccharothrix sp.]
MATIQVRDVPDEVADTLRRRAAMAGQSLQVYMRELLIKTAIRPDKAELMALLERARKNDPNPGVSSETIRSWLEETRGGE